MTKLLSVVVCRPSRCSCRSARSTRTRRDHHQARFPGQSGHAGDDHGLPGSGSRAEKISGGYAVTQIEPAR
jgi:hypothetical protein